MHKYFHSKQTGFTLIELMVVVVIISILATIALPIYQGFTSKTQIHSAYQTLSSLKAPIDFKRFNGEEITSSTDVGWLSGSSSLIETDPTVSIDTSTGETTLEATIDGSAHPLAKGVKITLLRAVQGGWSCIITKSSTGGWKDSIAPTLCGVVE